LSKRAVARLAGNAGLSERIHAQTAGNPFYVTELLASPRGSIPATIREATLARAMRLSPEARDLLEFCSVVPSRVERWLVDESSSQIDECIATGLIVHHGDTLSFRHELARLAIESAVPPSRRQQLHETVLGRLLERGVGAVATSRLVHHAAQAGDGAAVRRYAPEAAREASALGAHREAAAHYQTALEHTAADDIEARATLSESQAYECYLIDQTDNAIQACETALSLRRQQGNRLKVGDNLRWMSRLVWFRGRGADARKLAMEAIQTLEQLSPSRELAMAYSNMAALNMLSEDCQEAVEWGNRALELAERLGLTEVVVHALNSVGDAEFLMGKLGGTAKVERSLELALAHEMHEHAARAYTNLIYEALIVRDYALGETRLAAGLAYTRERDLDSWMLYKLAMRARARLEQGSWQEAEEDACTVLKAGQTVARVVAIAVLGCARLRRGDPSAAALLDEARTLALATGDIMRIGPMAAARAEAAWLEGEKEKLREEISAAYELALQRPEPWRLGELSLWMWRAGALERPPEGIPAPYRSEINGDWQAAAAVWQRIGCPYERALALANGDQPAKIQALEILDNLGAAPAAALVRHSLRAQGVRRIPRGPRRSTKSNPLGLTARESDILCLLAENLTNKEIAARLNISPKTVDHHIVAVLAKLGVSTRREAAIHPATRDLVAKHRESAPPR
jgi:DNA-binding CsgD family transcriptional regulator